MDPDFRALSLLHPIADAIARYQEDLANDPNFAEVHCQLAAR
jgi:hypothetical protein